jgi:outer membrane protein insertion porin family
VAEDGLGARNFFGGPQGGERLLVFNQEVRFPIYRWLRGVGFLDAGNVFTDPADAGEFVTSAGGGLRLSTPFGVLRADYGRVISQGDLGSGRFTFGIGQTF